MPYTTKIGYNISVKKVLKNLTFLVALFVLPLFLHAETGGFAIGIDQSPQNPNQKVKLTISGYLYDINSASVSWFKNDKPIPGSGRSITVYTPDYGVYDNYKAKIQISGNYFEVFYTLGIESVDLIYEADNTYTMPFYKGRPLPSKQSVIKVSAIPGFSSGSSLVNTSDVVYDWKQNGTNQANYSGLGKRFYLYQNSYFYNVDDIEVSVSSNGKLASKDVAVNLYPETIMFYENHPTQGVLFNKNLSSGVFLPNNSEYSMVAYPFGFSVKDATNKDLTYSWKINNEKINTPDKKNILNLRTGPEAGYSVINLNVDSISKLYQESEKNLYVNY